VEAGDWLSRDAFAVTEQGKRRRSTFLKSIRSARGTPAAAPKRCRSFRRRFSNFSPFPEPAAVNVLLLDSLNTKNEDLSVVHGRC